MSRGDVMIVAAPGDYGNPRPAVIVESDAHPTLGARHSFNGSIQHPRQILPGGYISWTDPETLEIQQILWVDPSQPP